MPRMVNSNRGGPVILAGASVRSLAESAVMSGIRPICFDMFADADLSLLLRENGLPDSIQISEFADLVAATSLIPTDVPLVWMGGLENHPEILRQLSEQRDVRGVQADELAALRNPAGLRSIVAGTECHIPAVFSGASDKQDLPRHQTWLAKPIDGAGGIGIREHKPGTLVKPGEFFQQKVAGIPVSALYYSDGQAVQMLGASTQVIGEAALGGSGFTFCGNVGPVRMPVRARTIVRKIGERIGDTGLRGVFGVDFIIDADNVWLIEVNPRITASHEIYDFITPEMTVLHRQLNSSTNMNAGDWEGMAPAELSGGGAAPMVVVPRQQQPCPPRDRADFTLDDRPQMLAKLVVYLQRDRTLTVSDVTSLLDLRRSPDWPTAQSCWLADIPQPGYLPSGQPFCSVYHVVKQTVSGWTVAGSHSQTVKIDAIVSQMAGVAELDSAATAIRYASLFE
jgi:predicted ATP-grasp superfamily ATP-dependent carboligase